jgi:hypothetical protein
MYAEANGHSRGSMRRIRGTYGALAGRLVISGVALCVVLAGCGPKQGEFLPPHLGESSLARRLQGEEARAIVDRMHGKGVAPLFSQIGFYGDTAGAGALLYVSVYEHASGAAGADEKMRVRIAQPGGAFSDYAQYHVAGRLISSCEGMGQRHYFFAAGKRLYWIAAPEASAFSLVQELVTGLKSAEPDGPL